MNRDDQLRKWVSLFFFLYFTLLVLSIHAYSFIHIEESESFNSPPFQNIHNDCCVCSSIVIIFITKCMIDENYTSYSCQVRDAKLPKEVGFNYFFILYDVIEHEKCFTEWFLNGHNQRLVVHFFYFQFSISKLILL